MMPAVTRRQFVQASASLLIGVSLPASVKGQTEENTLIHAPDTANLFSISLAQWSLHKALFAREIDHLDFPEIARSRFGIDAIEYVNTFFKDKARDQDYLIEMKKRAADQGVKSLLIMCDGEGRLGDPDAKARRQAVDNHVKWLEAAEFLGCHSIRVNAASEGSFEQQQQLAADGLRQLCEMADGFGLNVLVENHGGLSSNGSWLAGVMKLVDHPRVGTLPDFGNFRIRDDVWYDRYQGVTELMPYAKAVSAKSHDFDDAGNETGTDYRRMMKIVLDAGYHGYVGIEYEGSRLSEMDGIAATKALLERVREELAG
ncbi:MAG: sugar phosphate isomerase/epimerase [Phycisphaeraceae bacterium]